MGYHPRIETTNLANLTTIRSRNSELWFVKNPKLENAILGYVAKYAERYTVQVYAFCIEGNHLHGVAHFPNANRAHFMRDLNACVARAIPRYVSTYPGGRFWARRYSAEYLPDAADIERKFFYTVLQAVQDGLVDRISDYPGYNCFHDAVCGVTRTFKLVNWSRYNEARRWSQKVAISDFLEEFKLEFKRLPGYSELSQTEYKKLMYAKLEQYRQEILARRGTPAVGPRATLQVIPGGRPVHTKTSTRCSHRPRVLTGDPALRRPANDWYFGVLYEYREASLRFRSGELNTSFPPGTYRPPMFTVKSTVAPFVID